MATEVTVHEAKTNLSRLLVRVEAGEEIVIRRGKTPVARLSKLTGPAKPPRVLGALRGILVVPEDFDDPLPGDVLDLFEGAG